MVVISVYTYGVKMIKNSSGKVVFSGGGGVPWNLPLCTNRSAGYLMQLSVKAYKGLYMCFSVVKTSECKTAGFATNSKPLQSSPIFS